MRVCDAALEILTETDNPAIGWGDVTLLHMVAVRAGLPSANKAWKSERAVLSALSRQPGPLIPGFTRIHRRRVRIFRLPAPPTPSADDHA